MQLQDAKSTKVHQKRIFTINQHKQDAEGSEHDAYTTASKLSDVHCTEIITSFSIASKRVLTLVNRENDEIFGF